MNLKINNLLPNKLTINNPKLTGEKNMNSQKSKTIISVKKSSFGMTDGLSPSKNMQLFEVTFSDNSKSSFMTEGKLRGFLPNGILTSQRTTWFFLDPAGTVVGEKTKKEIGDLFDSTPDFYVFKTKDDEFFAHNEVGERLGKLNVRRAP